MTRKIRVLQVIDRLGNGGAEHLLSTFAAGVNRSRFDLHICTLRPWAWPQDVPALRGLGFPIIELDQHHSYDLHILGTLVNYIRREKIDIIHTHLLASDVMGRLAGFITRRPVVSTIHNARVDLDKEPLHLQLMERWSAHLWCRRLIVVSTLLRGEIAEWFGLPLSKVITITNGVDTALFRPPPGFDPSQIKREILGSHAGNLRMVSNVARLVPQKAQRYLVEAAALVTATRPDVRFVLVGEGPLLEEITQIAADQGVTDRLVIAGPRTDVPLVLAATDVFVLSSLWEGMPISLLEAMAAGCPVVATDVGGVAQMVRQGVTGLLVPPGDPEALAAAIADCLDHPDLARQRAKAGQALVTARYDKSVMIRKLEIVYEHEVKRRRSKASGFMPRRFGRRKHAGGEPGRAP